MRSASISILQGLYRKLFRSKNFVNVGKPSSPDPHCCVDSEERHFALVDACHADVGPFVIRFQVAAES